MASDIERDRKIRKLTKMIKAKEKEMEVIELKQERAKTQVSKGDISKGDYQRLSIELSRERKALRGAITRLERGRLNRERKIKERALDREQKERERQQRREQRALERERRKEEKEAKKAE